MRYKMANVKIFKGFAINQFYESESFSDDSHGSIWYNFGKYSMKYFEGVAEKFVVL